MPVAEAFEQFMWTVDGKEYVAAMLGQEGQNRSPVRMRSARRGSSCNRSDLTNRTREGRGNGTVAI